MYGQCHWMKGIELRALSMTYRVMKVVSRVLSKQRCNCRLVTDAPYEFTLIYKYLISDLKVQLALR